MLSQSSSHQISTNTNESMSVAFLSLLALAFVVRIGLFLIFQSWDPTVQETKILVGDAPGYHEYALRIVEGRPLGDLGVQRTPGYPLIVAAAYTVFGAKPWVVLLLQIGASVITLALLYRLTLIWFDQNAAIVAGLLYALEPHAVLYTLAFYTDSFFVTVFVGAVVVFLQALKSRSGWSFFWAGALLGVGTLIRPVSQFLPVVFILMSVLFFRRQGLTALRGGAILFVGYLIVVTPWLYRNHDEYGAAKLTSIGGEMLLNWTVPYIETARTGMTISEARQEFMAIARRHGADKTSNPFELSRIQTEVAVDYIKRHPREYALGSLRGAFYSFMNLDTSGYANVLRLRVNTSPDDWYGGDSVTDRVRMFIRVKSVDELVIASLIGIVLFMTYLMCFVGIWYLLKYRNYWPLIFVVAMIVYFMMFIGPIGIARYKLPVVPLYLSIAGFGASRILSERNKQHRT